MASENKTNPTETDFEAFLAKVEPSVRRDEARILNTILKEITGESPVLWGPSIVGYGAYHYVYDSGRSGDSCRIGFSPRKPQLVLYLNPGFDELGPLLDRLGKHSTARSCLYIKKLADVDLDVLAEILRASWDEMARRYPQAA
jgi:hypothetical protein